jgi:hypothetical protein
MVVQLVPTGAKRDTRTPGLRAAVLPILGRQGTAGERRQMLRESDDLRWQA